MLWRWSWTETGDGQNLLECMHFAKRACLEYEKLIFIRTTNTTNGGRAIERISHFFSSKGNWINLCCLVEHVMLLKQYCCSATTMALSRRQASTINHISISHSLSDDLSNSRARTPASTVFLRKKAKRFSSKRYQLIINNNAQFFY